MSSFFMLVLVEVITMKIIFDDQKQYYDEVITHLRKHNNKFAGDIPHGERHFYLVENNEVKAGVKMGYSWSWASFKMLKYRNINDLRILMQSVQSYFKDIVTGLKFFTEDIEKAKDMEQVGFIFEAKLVGTSKVKDSLYLLNTHFMDLDVDVSNIVESEEGIEEYNLILQTDQKSEELSDYVSFIALESDTFAGGVVGYITEDKLYVDLLVVVEGFKGRGVGSMLMDQIEDYAVKKGCIIFNLGTAEFQAKPFYEKRGYKMIMTLEDNPKGYQCYTMQKRI